MRLGPEFTDWLYSYVESGIPFVLSIPNHVVTCVGHGPTSENLDEEEILSILDKKVLDENMSVWMLNTSKLVSQYIVMDDNAIPYYATSVDSLIEKYCEDRIVQHIE